MQENKKVILEEGTQDQYKRMTVEQGLSKDHQSQTPKWDKMKVSLKEGTADKTTLFVQAFARALLPSFIIGIIIITIIAIKIFG